MNYSTIIGVVAGLLQFAVAGYALKLNRTFGTKRVGWSLVCAFALLALLNLMQSFLQRGSGVEFVIKTDVMNAVISLLLLIGMVHLESTLKERARIEREEQTMRDELESEVKKKTAFLTRALEELQSEIDERKRLDAENQTVRWELDAVSRRAEIARIAASVLASVGEMLKSVDASAHVVSDQVKKSRIANVVRMGAQIREHNGDLSTFLTKDPDGQQLPNYIAQLAEHLGTEQSTLLTQLESIKEKLEDIRALQQDFVKLAGEKNGSGKEMNVVAVG